MDERKRAQSCFYCSACVPERLIRKFKPLFREIQHLCLSLEYTAHSLLVQMQVWTWMLCGARQNKVRVWLDAIRRAFHQWVETHVRRAQFELLQIFTCLISGKP